MGRRQVNLDWFNVTYRSMFVLALLAVVAGAGGFWGYQRLFGTPGSQIVAQEAITKASVRLAEAKQFDAVDSVETLLTKAGNLLTEARTFFETSAFDDAQVSAIRSETLSQKAIGMLRGDENEGHTARFVRLEGDVRVKRRGEFSWEPANRDMRLEAGDQIKTSSTSSVQLLYFDGTKTTILPGSLLEIRELREDPATKVRQVKENLKIGEVVASTKKRNVDGSFHEVATPNVAARTENAGEFKVSVDEDKNTETIDVFNGSLQVVSADRKEVVSEGERQQVRDGKMLAKETIPAAPRLIAPADQRILTFDDSAQAKAHLTWDRVPGAREYRLEIASTSLFTDPLYGKAHNGISVTLDQVPEGSYYWRVAAIDSKGAQGPFAKARTFTVSTYKIRDRGDTIPPILEITEAVPAGSMLIINGRTEPGAQVWIDSERVDVSNDGTFYSVLRLRKEGLNELVLVAQDAAGNENRVVHTAYADDF